MSIFNPPFTDTKVNATTAFTERRRRGIGGSDAAAICGESRYKSAYDIYESKIRAVDSSVKDSLKEDIFARGHELEPYCKLIYSLDAGNAVIEKPDMYIHQDYDFIIANVDGLTSNGRILECKTADNFVKKDWGKPGTDKIPIDYKYQVAHYCMVLNIEYADIIVLFGDKAHFDMLRQTSKEIGLSADLSEDYAIYTYKRDREFEKTLLEKEVAFWFNHVKKMIPPVPETIKDILKIYPTSNDECAEASEKEEGIIELIKFKEKSKENLEGEIEKLKAQICFYMKSNSTLVNSIKEPLATWKDRVTSTFDKKALDKDNPGMVEKYTKKSTSRTLLIK